MADAASSTPLAPRSCLVEVAPSGAFLRTPSAYRDWISADPSSKYPAEKDRYHVYISYACPWACRVLMMRALKGLEDVISVTIVHPIWQKTKPGTDDHAGWFFGDTALDNKVTLTNSEGKGGPFPTHFTDTEPDPLTGSASIRALYERDNDKQGKYSVPVLFDKKQKEIVNNESSDIIRMLNSEFNALAKYPNADFYPEELRGAIDEINSWVYPSLNNGVYRCGFAKSQEAYDEAIGELTEAFDRVDQILQKSRFLTGDRMTEADIRLFVTLVRFDEVYTVYFKTNTRFVCRTESMLNYLRDIYQMPGMSSTVNMEHIKMHYYCSHPVLSTYSIVPRGANFMKLLDEPHNRFQLFAK